MSRSLDDDAMRYARCPGVWVAGPALRVAARCIGLYLALAGGLQLVASLFWFDASGVRVLYELIVGYPQYLHWQLLIWSQYWFPPLLSGALLWRYPDRAIAWLALLCSLTLSAALAVDIQMLEGYAFLAIGNPTLPRFGLFMDPWLLTSTIAPCFILAIWYIASVAVSSNVDGPGDDDMRTMRMLLAAGCVALSLAAAMSPWPWQRQSAVLFVWASIVALCIVALVAIVTPRHLSFATSVALTFATVRLAVAVCVDVDFNVQKGMIPAWYTLSEADPVLFLGAWMYLSRARSKLVPLVAQLCPHCGYALDSCPSNQCAECGTSRIPAGTSCGFSGS